MSRWMPRWSGLDWGQRARQGSLVCIQRPASTRRAATGRWIKLDRDRWEAESSSVARCQLSIPLVLGIEHGEAEREAAAKRPDYIQLPSQGLDDKRTSQSGTGHAGRGNDGTMVRMQWPKSVFLM
ncbi:hypothetical protein ACSS6W_005475 [Trichoderma asperelloides]